MSLTRTSSTETVPYFRLRVLLEYDRIYKVFAAHCLETGNVVTADTPGDAKSMIKELLEDEINFALEYKNLRNLFCAPAPMDIWNKWQSAARENDIETIPLNVSAREIKLDQDEEVKNEVSFAQTAA